MLVPDLGRRLGAARAAGRGLSLEDKQAVNRALLRSGAAIGEMNCVRKHLSAIKGGRLAAAAFPARVVSLLISDVPGDDPAVIAAARRCPIRPPAPTRAAILARYGIELPRGACGDLLRPAARDASSPAIRASPAPRSRLIAAPQLSLEAAAAVARAAGVTPVLLGDAIEGEAREVGKVMAGIARSVAPHGQPVAPPCVLLSGGETTVTVRGDGRGGRNVEFLLGARRRAGRPAAASMRSPATPTASTAPRRTPAPSSRPTRSPAPAPRGLDPRATPRRQRRPRPVRGAGRPGDHRPDAHQRQRFPRRPGPAALTTAAVARPGARRYVPAAFWRDGRVV